jgi:hypothetical protein
MASDTGKDDKAYIALMDKYKRARITDGQGAMKYLDAAVKLRETGDVSSDAVLGGAYL